MNLINKAVLTLLVASIGLHPAFAACNSDTTTGNSVNIRPDAGNAGLVLPSGFSAVVVASNVGQARHLAVTPQGDLYVKLDGNVKGKGVLYMHDANKDGKAEN